MNSLFPFLLFHKKYNFFFLLIVSILTFSCNNNERTWSSYKADAESSSYSSLKEINKENVQRLQVAWTFNPNDAPEGGRQAGSQCNPIVIDGVMYTASARHRIYAVDANTGKQIWAFDPYNGGPGGGSFRGVTYWEDGNDKRILFTGGDKLFAVNAIDGKLISSFGKNGSVSMNIGIRDDPEKISIKPTSPGIVFKDLLIIGNEVSELYGAQPGYVRAYNIKSGKLEWTFHTIPKPGETGYETWPADAWKYAGGANSWGGMSVDIKREMVFFSTGSPTYDFYGFDRKGKNLFGNCVVALHAATGKLAWYYQTVHHDLWDYDLPAPPNLVTVVRAGKKIDAVAQTSKVGFLYVFNRETGEEAWPTQPFPLKPKPYSRQYITVDSLSSFSSSANDSLVTLFKSLRYEGLFTPPSERGTLYFPGTIGGSEWGGAAFDKETNIIYLKANESPEIARLQKIDPANASSTLTPYEEGKAIYVNYCASCHKQDRKGDETSYPSLIDLEKRMSEAAVIEKIKQGSGKMPSFAPVVNGHEQAIISYLFEKQEKHSSQAGRDLAEIRQNRLSNIEVKKEKILSDTAITYLNTNAYSQLKDKDGHPPITPPWGTLNAIDLNTGEYVWKVPAGNMVDLQKKGEPNTGSTGSPGAIVTAGGLVFLGGSRDKKLQGYDKTTGKLIWETTLPGIASSTPCTYSVAGKQYVAVSVAGSKDSPAGLVVAFALPD